jgi:hypothetical protein
MTTYNWQIANLESNVSDGGVTIAHWRVTAVDGDYSASSYGTVGFTPDTSADGFVAYDSLTEDAVLAWVYESVNKDDTESALQAKIDADKTPTTQSGIPWATEEVA